jgi:cysteine dioxygenase
MSAIGGRVPLSAEEQTTYSRVSGKLLTLIESLKFALANAAQSAAALPTVDADAIKAALQAYAVAVASGECAEEIRPYLFASSIHYTRNLVFSSDDFEVIVLCWGTQHGSRVHNHAVSHCWMGVLNSTVVEQRFVPALRSSENQLTLTTEAATPALADAQSPPPLLVVVSESNLDAGQCSYINDAVALHRVAAFHTSVKAPNNVANSAAAVVHANAANSYAVQELLSFGSVTLHVYSPPIRRVKIFEPGQPVYARTPGFFSINGQKH